MLVRNDFTGITVLVDESRVTEDLGDLAARLTARAGYASTSSSGHPSPSVDRRFGPMRAPGRELASCRHDFAGWNLLGIVGSMTTTRRLADSEHEARRGTAECEQHSMQAVVAEVIARYPSERNRRRDETHALIMDRDKDLLDRLAQGCGPTSARGTLVDVAGSRDEPRDGRPAQRAA